MVYHPNYWNSQVLLLLPLWPALSCKAYANVESTIITKWPDLTSVFKKDDRREIGHYRPLSLLSVHVPSKILKSCVADMIVKYAFSDNEARVRYWQPMGLPKREIDRAITHPPDWNLATSSWLVVGVVFIDFQKAFDCVSQPIHKIEHNFGITGNLLASLRDYLSEREQCTVINGDYPLRKR